MKRKYNALQCIPSNLVQFCLHLHVRVQIQKWCMLLLQLSLYQVQSQS